MTDIKDTLAALSEAATQGEWQHEPGFADWGMPKVETVIAEGNPIAILDSVQPYCAGSSRRERELSASQYANAAFIVALVNAYRSGQLVPVRAAGGADMYDTPSARITGDKDRENPVEGAQLARRILILTEANRHLTIECIALRDCLRHIADAGYVDHQSGNQNFEYLQSLAREKL